MQNMKERKMIRDKFSWWEVVAGDVPRDKDGTAIGREIRYLRADPDKNKHVPYTVEVADGYESRCGKHELHMVTEEHFIAYIELIIDDRWHHRYYFKAGDQPKVHFQVPKGKKVIARALCNFDSLWEYELPTK